MLSNIPFNVKDWLAWFTLWLAVGFLTAWVSLTPAHALGRGHGPLCYLAHPAAYCDAPKPREVYEQEERENRALSQIGGALQGAGAALQSRDAYRPAYPQPSHGQPAGPQFYQYQDRNGFNHNCQVNTYGPNTTVRCPN